MFRLIKAKNGTPIIEYNGEEGTHTLSSRYDPRKEAERILAGQDLDCDFVILFGAGNLELCSLLTEKLKGQGLIIIERDSEVIEMAVKHLADNNITVDPSAGIYIFDGDNYRDGFNNIILGAPSKRIKFFINRAQAALFQDFYAEARQKVIEIHERKSINTATLSRFERLWLRNICRNTKLIIEALPIKELAGTASELSAVIVGAGPSLAEELPLLSEKRDNVIIIAVDTVYKALLRHEIIPDIVVVVDPQKINSMYVENIPADQRRDTVFICEPAVCTKGISEARGSLVMFNTIFPYYAHICSYFGDKGDIEMGGSVATTAFETARLLGFKAATFLGLDLCYYDDACHIPGTMYEEFWFSTVGRYKPFDQMTFKLMDYASLVPVTNREGQPVYMDSKFTLFRNWFERRLKAEQWPVSNSSRRGIEIAGMDYISFSDFLARHAVSSETKSEYRAKISSLVRHSAVIPADSLASFLADTGEIIQNITTYQELCARAGKLAVKISRKIAGKKDVVRDLSVLDEMEKEMSADFPGKLFVNIAVQNIIHKINEGHEIDLGGEFSEEQKAIETSRYLYGEMEESARLNVRYLTGVCRLLSQD